MPRASHAQPPQAQSQPSQASPDEGRFYPNPGIVANRGGRWVGSDHLYNLTDKIDIVVEIFKPENVQVPVSEEMIKARVIEIFKKGKIEPQAESAPGKPPLPFFHLLLMIYPIDKGYVALCEGRLFEEVHLDRIILDEQTVLQGITWESENLIVSPSADIEEQVFKSVDEIANTFVDRFIFYSNIKAQIKKR
jgi:hypothetical protein